jgi:hypothetical protein
MEQQLIGFIIGMIGFCVLVLSFLFSSIENENDPL